MIDDVNMTALIANDIMSFESVSRFAGAGFSLLSRDKNAQFIKINEDDDGITVSCEIIVYFGVNIPQLCYDIQSRVKKNVEASTGLNVKAVNIRVEGIDSRA